VVSKQRVEIAAADRRLVEDRYADLRRFAAVTASRDIDPDDLLQEALVRVLSQGSLSEREQPLAYLRRTIVNLAIDHARRREARHTAMGKWTGTDATVDTYPSDLAILQELTPRARAVVYLSEVEGYRYREIAEMLDCNEAAARVGAMRARRRLRQVLDSEAAHG
jgi:DNA-directed RNA polymerase specialized sigma24 family protein